MAEKSKNKNDTKKKEQEENVLANAIRLSKTKKKMTRDILALLNGNTVDREREERPDFVRAVCLNQDDATETVIGIEHFLVEQVSRDDKSNRVSIIRENRSYAEDIIDNKEEYLKDQKKEIIARKKIAETIYDIAVHTNKSGISDLKKSFYYVFEKHLSNIDEYRENLEIIADGKPVQTAFLIELHSNADDVYLNNGKSVERRRNGVYPIFEWVVEELEKADPDKLNYIVIYMTNSVNADVEDVVAIDTKDIRGSLRKQGIIIYEYCDDPCQIDFQKYGMNENGFEYSVEVNNKNSYVNDLLPVLQQAYKYKRQSIPFVVPRSVQTMMFAYGKASFKNDTDNTILISEFEQKEALRRFDEFVGKYPID